MNNTATWRQDLITAVGNLNFQKFFTHTPTENDHYPAYMVDEVVDRFAPGDETGEMATVERTTVLYIQVAVKDRDWNKAESRCFDLATDVQKSIDVHFSRSVNWVKRRMYRAAVSARDVVVCQLEFARSIIEVV